MSIISGIGITSGINYDQLISSIIKIERQPINRLQNRQSAYNNKISVYSTLSTKLSSLKTAADNLRTSSNFYAKTAYVSDTTVLEATASNSAASGSYSISVTQLAYAETRKHDTAYSSSTAVVNNSGSDKYFEYVYNGFLRRLTVANSSTLKDLRDLINNDAHNPEVSATIINDGTGYRLVLTGGVTGAGKAIGVRDAESKQFHAGVSSTATVVNSSGGDKVFKYTYGLNTRTITVEDGTTLEELRDLINAQDSGLAAINYDATSSSYKLVFLGSVTIDDVATTLDGTGNTVDFRSTTFTSSSSGTTLSGFGSSNFTQTRAPQDAIFTVNNITINKSSNTVSDVINGVTFTLKKEGGASSTLTISNDTNSIRQKIETFITAYNDIATYVSSNSTYDTTTRTGGPLFGETTSRNITTRLRSIFTSRVTGLPEDLRMLAQIGISTNRDGTLSLNTSTLNSKLTTDLTKVADLFTDSTGGIARQVYDYTSTVTDSTSGSITIRKKGIGNLVSDITDEISTLESRLSRTEENLIRQFSRLEALLGGLSSQGAFLTNQINIWSRR